MIKINLLESVTDRQRGSVAVVEQKVANPRMQTILMAMVVASLLVLGMGYDYVSANSEKAAAQKELENQQRIFAQMQAVNKEQAELAAKTKEIQDRIDAIQKLRASQQGPSAVLKAIKDRIDQTPGLYLESVDQKSGDIVIKGNSPSEAAVTRFGQSLEFSSGLFSNLNIETTRKTVDEVAKVTVPAGVTVDTTGPKPEIVNFSIKCVYTPPAPPASTTSSPATASVAPTNQVAQK
jgi:Tfp pilus assembly protein PilN